MRASVSPLAPASRGSEIDALNGTSRARGMPTPPFIVPEFVCLKAYTVLPNLHRIVSNGDSMYFGLGLHSLVPSSLDQIRCERTQNYSPVVNALT
jgi:hypothetical protein